MRAAWILVLAIGCSKHGAEPGAEPGARESMPAVTPGSGPPNSAPPPPEAPTEAVAAGARADDQSAARDEARSNGVLGPTEGSAFTVKGTVSIKRASTKPLDGAVRPTLETLQTCYDQALEMNDSLVGELTLAIAAGVPQVTKSTLHDTELEQCVVAALRGVELPKSRATLVLAFARE